MFSDSAVSGVWNIRSVYLLLLELLPDSGLPKVLHISVVLHNNKVRLLSLLSLF